MRLDFQPGRTRWGRDCVGRLALLLIGLIAVGGLTGCGGGATPAANAVPVDPDSDDNAAPKAQVRAVAPVAEKSTAKTDAPSAVDGSSDQPALPPRDGRKSNPNAKVIERPGISISEDAMLAAAGTDQGSIGIFDVRRGLPIRVFRGLKERVSAVAFSPNQEWLASGTKDGQLRMWSLKTADGLDDLARTQTDGGSGFDVPGHNGAVRGLALSKLADQLVSVGDDGALRVWDLPFLPGTTLGSIGESPVQLQVSRSGKLVAAAARGNLVVIEFLSGQKRLEITEIRRQLTCVEFSPDEQFVICGDEQGQVYSYQLVPGGKKNSWLAHEGPVVSAAFSEDLREVVTVGADQLQKRWQFPLEESKQISQVGSAIRIAAISPSLDLIAVARGRDVALIDGISGKERKLFKRGNSSDVTAMAISANREAVLIGTAAGTIEAWNAGDGQRAWELNGHVGPVLQLVVDRNGQRLASSGQDGKLMLWTMGSRPTTVVVHRAPIEFIEADRKGRYVASGSRDGSIQIWNSQLGEPLKKLDSSGAPTTALFSSQGDALFVGTSAGQLRGWSVENWNLNQDLRAGSAALSALATTSKGDLLWTGTKSGQVRGWTLPLAAAEPLNDLAAPISSLVIAPGSRQLWIGATDGSLRIHEPVEGRLIRELAVNLSPITAMTASEGKSLLVLGHADGSLSVWDSRSGAALGTYQSGESAVEQITATSSGEVAWRNQNRELRALSLPFSKAQGLDLKNEVPLCLAVSPDGKSAAAGLDSGHLVCWDLKTAKRKWDSALFETAIRTVTWTEDSRELVCGTANGQVATARATDGQRGMTWTGPANARLVAAGKSDGLVLSVHGDQSIQVWKRSSPQSVTVRNVATPKATVEAVTVIDQDRFAWGTATGQVLLAQVSAPAVQTVLQLDGQIKTLAVSADLKSIAAADDQGQVQWIGLAPNSTPQKQSVADQSVLALCWSPEGDRIRGATSTGQLVEWKQDGRLLSRRSAGTNALVAVAATGNGNPAGNAPGATAVPGPASIVQAALSAAEGDLALFLTDADQLRSVRWNAAQEGPKVDGSVPLASVELDGSSQAFLAQGKAIDLWNLATGKIEESVITLQEEVTALSIAKRADARNGSDPLLLIGLRGGQVVLWNLQKSEVDRTWSTGPSAVKLVQGSADGRSVITVSEGGSVSLWEAGTGELVQSYEQLALTVQQAVLSPDQDALLVHGGDKSILRLPVSLKASWNASTTGVLALAPLPKGGLVTLSEGENAIRFWDAGGQLSGDKLVSGKTKLGAIAAGGELAVTTSDLRTVKIWNLTTRAAAGEIEIAGEILQLQISRDGQRIGILTRDGKSRVYDPTGKNLLQELPMQNGVQRMAFEGPALVTGHAEGTLRWHRGADRQELSGQTVPLTALAFLPDGRLVGGGQDQLLHLWRVSNPTEPVTVKGHTGPVRSIAVSDDGRRLCSGSTDQQVIVWDVAAIEDAESRQSPLKNIREWNTGAPVLGLTMTGNGQRLATRSDKEPIQVWNAENGSRMDRLAGHPGGIVALSYSKDGDRLLSAGQDKSIRLWRTALKQMMPFGKEKSVAAERNTGLRTTLLVESKQVSLWSDIGSQVRQFPLKGRPISARIRPDGQQIAIASIAPGAGSGDSTISLFNISDGVLVETLKLPAAVTGCAYSPDSRRLMVGQANRTVRIYDLEKNRLLENISTVSVPEQVAVSADGQAVLVAEQDRALRRYVRRVRLFVQAHEGPATAVTMTADGKVVMTAGTDGTARIWSLDDGRHMATLSGGPFPLLDVNLGAGGVKLSASSREQGIQIWSLTNLATGAKPLPPTDVYKLPGGATRARISRSGKFLAIGASDHSIRVWDTSTSKEISRLEGHKAPIAELQFSPDDRQLISCANDRSLRVWNMPVAEGESKAAGPVRIAAEELSVDATPDNMLAALKLRETTSQNEEEKTLVQQYMRQLGSDLHQTPTSNKPEAINSRKAELERLLRTATSADERAQVRERLRMVQREEELETALKSTRDEAESQKIRDELTELKRETDASVTAASRMAKLEEELASVSEPAEKKRLQAEINRLKGSTGESWPPAATADETGPLRLLATLPTDYAFDYRLFRPVKLAVSLDGRTVVAARESARLSDSARSVQGVVEVWDAPTGIKLRSWTEVANDRLKSVALSQDQQNVYTLPDVRCLQIPTGKSRLVAKARSYAWMPGRDNLLLGLDGEVLSLGTVLQIIDSNTGEKTPRRIEAYEATVPAIALRPDGKQMAVALRERNRHQLLLFDPADLNIDKAAVIDEQKHSKTWHEGDGSLGIVELCFSPDGEFLVSYAIVSEQKRALTIYHKSGRKTVIERDAAEGSAVPEFRFIPGSSRLAVIQSNRMTVVDLGKGAAVGQVELPAVPWGRAEHAFTDMGTHLAAGDETGRLVIYDLVNGKAPVMQRCHRSPIVGVGVSLDGKFLVTAGEENQVKLWLFTSESTGSELVDGKGSPKPEKKTGTKKPVRIRETKD